MNRFNYYNLPSRIILMLLAIGPFLGFGIYFLLYGNVLAKILSIVLFFLCGVFVFKSTAMHVSLDDKGIHYKSWFKTNSIAWDELHDILIVVRERRNNADYYKYEQWFADKRLGKGYFLLFRADQSFPENPMFMFSTPVSENYISVQYRGKLQQVVDRYYKKTPM